MPARMRIDVRNAYLAALQPARTSPVDLPTLGRSHRDTARRACSRVNGLASLFIAIISVAGCAHQTGARAPNDGKNTLWTGRIALQIESAPPQAFFAGFELQGQVEKGQLSLTSPIGSTVALMRWSPAEATLESGGEIKRFDSVDALLERTTGAAVPVAALFDWLSGKNTSLNGWTADLSQQASGRIDATRVAPLPVTKLRIVLEQ